MAIHTFSERVLNVFNAFNTNHECMTALMSDLALGREIYDAETDKVIPKAEAEATVLEFSRQILGVTPEMIEHKDAKAIKRAFRDNKRDWYDVIEDTLDITTVTGIQASEWFNNLANTINIGYGDRQDLIAETESVLSVATVGTSHHDHIMQRLAPGQRYTIPTARHAVKVGADINKYILGQVAWDKFVAAIDAAYMLDIQSSILASVDAAVTALGIAWKGTGALGASTKQAFLDICDNVSDANGGSEVIVLGTKNALRKITAIGDVDWAADKQKDSMADNGNIGWFEGTTLVRIPNRFSDNTLTSKVFDDKTLYILASGASNKLVTLVEEGSIEVDEVTEKGISNGYIDDLMSFEVQRIYGAGVVPGAVFGAWILP